MAGVFLNKFKERMGHSAGIVLGLDISSILQPIDGLQNLTRPFEKEEMDLVIKAMPSDKAPGSNGFNGLFLK